MRRRIFRSTPNLDQLLAEDTGHQINVLSKTIGAGAEGCVLLASLLRPSQSPFFFAVKKGQIRNLASGDTAEHEQELHHIATRYHSNVRRQTGILPYMGVFADINSINHRQTYHAMPLAESVLNHSIPGIIALKTTNRTLYHCLIFDFLNCMLHGLSQLSEAEIVHNDLSTKNILLYKKRWVISDFGQAEKYAEFSSPDSHPRGSPLNIPPEILVQDKRFPLARDIWALGQIMKELLGEPAMFHDTVPTGDVDAHIKAKKTTYLQLRQEQSQCENAQVDHQESLRQQISLQTTAQDCLSMIVSSMCHILPERRPDLVTFRMICDHLSRLLSAVLLSSNDVLTEFYASIQDEKLVVIHPALSPDSGEISDDIEVEVVDFSRNSSCRSSPSLANLCQP